MANRFQLWGQAGWASAEVVGESHYARAIRALFGPGFDPQGTEIDVPVQLMPDPGNRHDRNAVGVWSGSSLLGHLPRQEAARYVGVLSALVSRGLAPEVNARVHGREWAEYNGRPAEFSGSIRLDLAEPHMLVPVNPPPNMEHRLLPSGPAVQVVGEDPQTPVLMSLLRPEGECWAYVTLHEMADHRVEVRVGDARVGDLSPKMSLELLPALRHLSERGLVTAARAIVKGGNRKAEVVLHVARAHDLPENMQGSIRPAFAGSTGAGPVLPAGGLLPAGGPPGMPGSGETAVIPAVPAGPAPFGGPAAVRSVSPPFGGPLPTSFGAGAGTVGGGPSTGSFGGLGAGSFGGAGVQAPEPAPPAGHAPIPPAPSGVKFVVPPGWPTPPPGWYPPAGWRPDPGWPLAPADWQWWVPVWD